MNILYITLVVSFLFVGFFISLYIYAVKKGQFDDLETSSLLPLLDESDRKNTSTKKDKY